MNKHRAQTWQEQEWHFPIIFQSSCYDHSRNKSAPINFHKIIHVFSIMLQHFAALLLISLCISQNAYNRIMDSARYTMTAPITIHKSVMHVAI